MDLVLLKVFCPESINRCWLMHEAFAEALGRLLRERFIENSSDEIETTATSAAEDVNVTEVIKKAEAVEYIETYTKQMSKCFQGEFGKTPQFLVTVHVAG